MPISEAAYLLSYNQSMRDANTDDGIATTASNYLDVLCTPKRVDNHFIDEKDKTLIRGDRLRGKLNRTKNRMQRRFSRDAE